MRRVLPILFPVAVLVTVGLYLAVYNGAGLRGRLGGIEWPWRQDVADAALEEA